MAILELTVRGEVGGETYINRYDFVGTGTPASVSMSFALAHAFGAIPDGIPVEIPANSPMWYFLEIASTATQIFSVTVKNLYSVTDFYEIPYPTPEAGVQAGVPAAPFLVYPLTTNIVRTDVSRGRKAIGGVSESAMGANGVIETGILAYLADFCGTLSEPLVYDDEGNTLTFTSCVLSKQEYETPKGNRAYKLYDTEAAQLEHTAVGVTWSPKTKVSTENSRKPGHGN